MIVSILVLGVGGLEALAVAIALMYAEAARNRGDPFLLVVGGILCLAIAIFQAALLRTAGMRLFTAITVALFLAALTFLGAGVAVRLIHA